MFISIIRVIQQVTVYLYHQSYTASHCLSLSSELYSKSLFISIIRVIQQVTVYLCHQSYTASHCLSLSSELYSKSLFISIIRVIQQVTVYLYHQSYTASHCTLFMISMNINGSFHFRYLRVASQYLSILATINGIFE
jgi:hypothetical protein